MGKAQGIDKEAESFLAESEEATTDLGVFRERLTMQVRRLNALEEEPEGGLAPEDTPAFKAALKYFGEYPPIKLVKALGAHYEKTRNRILFGEIPEIMNEAGLRSAETVDGQTVTITKEVSATTNKERAGEALAWLMENGYRDHVKDILTFGKGDFDEEAEAALEELGVSYSRKSDVHFQTLRKIMSDRIDAGEELPPEDLITVKTADRAKVK